MRENTNKTILINSLILYLRLVVTAISGLFTARFALQALGVNDFGLFSVVGGIISFIAIINTIMISTSNRFISIEIGKGNTNAINEQFNINFVIHTGIAVIILMISYPLGDWYIFQYVNYEGNITEVIRIFNITIIGSVISFIGIPYNGLLMAKERFVVFCLTDIISSIARMGICYAMLFYFENKLMVYTLTNSVLAAYPTLVFIKYCSLKFPDIVRFKFVHNIKKYREVLSFSIWVAFGAVASVGRAQGGALIINAFFNTIMNTALGLANSVNSILMTLSNSVTKSISPQITKSYASGNRSRSESLVCLSSRVSFLFMLFVSSPFWVAPEFIFKLWLGAVPEYVISFTQLIIVDTLIRALNSGIPDLVFAVGNIKWYQVVESSLSIISIIIGLFALKAGAPASSLLTTYIIFSAIVLVVRQILLNKLVHFNNWALFKNSYLPSIIIVILFVPITIIKVDLDPIIKIIAAVFYLSILIFIIGLTKSERNMLKKNIIPFRCKIGC